MKGILVSGGLHSPLEREEGLLEQMEQVAGLAQRCSQCSRAIVGPYWPIYELTYNHEHLHVCAFYFSV